MGPEFFVLSKSSRPGQCPNLRAVLILGLILILVFRSRGGEGIRIRPRIRISEVDISEVDI